MIHVIQSEHITTVGLECDYCRASGPAVRYRGPEALAADRIRLRITARMRCGWLQRSILDPQLGAVYTGDLCRQCAEARRTRRRGCRGK